MPGSDSAAGFRVCRVPAADHKSGAAARDTADRQKPTGGGPPLRRAPFLHSQVRLTDRWLALADCTGNPEASSSLSDALKTRSTVPKNSTKRRDRVGPRPRVRVRASQRIWLESGWEVESFGSAAMMASGKEPSQDGTLPTLSSREKPCPGYTSHSERYFEGRSLSEGVEGEPKAPSEKLGLRARSCRHE